MSSFVFKVRHTVTGRYSNGGTWGDFQGWGTGWSTQGKVWSKEVYLKRHLNAVVRVRKTIPAEWEVVKLEIAEKESKPAYHYVDLIKVLRKESED